MFVDSFGRANSGSLVQRSQKARTVTSCTPACPSRRLLHLRPGPQGGVQTILDPKLDPTAAVAVLRNAQTAHYGPSGNRGDRCDKRLRAIPEAVSGFVGGLGATV